MIKIGFCLLISLLTLPILAGELVVTVLNIDKHPIKDIVVTVTPQDSNKSRGKLSAIEIKQKDKAFLPYINVIQQGQKVIFSNMDDITHHIFSASREQRFSFKLHAGKQRDHIKFTKPGQIPMGCNIHDWMSGYLLVVDTPYFSKTDANGIVRFKLEEIGQATIKIMHPQLTETKSNTTKNISLDGRSQHVSIELKENFVDIPQQQSGEDFDFLDDY